ncbi:MAG: DUF3160 domain-containing protein, partial [Patescibacteria group bacterium]
MTKRTKILIAVAAGLVIVTSGVMAYVYRGAFMPTPLAPTPIVSEQPTVLVAPVLTGSDFGASVVYEPPTQAIDPAIAKDFDVATVANITDMEKTYGFTFTAAERKALAENKFVMKNLLDTNIRPSPDSREFLGLYEAVRGLDDPRGRTQANALFLTSDVFFNAYNNLYVELLKEMENKSFFPAMKSISKSFFEKSAAHLASATTDADRKTWTKVRNYFAVPYAIFQNAAAPLSAKEYMNPDGSARKPSDVQAAYATEDGTVDTYDTAATFVRTLGLDADSEAAVLASLKQAFDAGGFGSPSVFVNEYEALAIDSGVETKVDFSQFKPRGTYTSSSLRRQYFRGMKWYIMVPFFLKSPDLTTYAYGVSQLLAEDPASLKDYDTLESAIGFMVGTSDDLMPVDYLKALEAGKDATDPAQAAMEYLVKAHDPKIKDLASSDGSLLSTKGMRFFSGKFIMDSYWTTNLTKAGFTEEGKREMPSMVSSLEVMTLLGSEYARTQIPKLDFYANHAAAIDRAVAELEAENAAMTETNWTANLYTSWLWTIRSLFSWQIAHLAGLPSFMQSPLWQTKTLMTGAGFWTELRHATILYAKQSLATEMGGYQAEPCDARKIPPPPKGYIEPQAEAYARLGYLAERTHAGLEEQGFALNNMGPLKRFITLMGTVRAYTDKELGNETLSERTRKESRPDDLDATMTCTEEFIDGTSDWETLRLGVLEGLDASMPYPVEGPILSAKDRRASVVADVHTDGNDMKVLYEGTGVPYVIFTAVSDANGPRLTVGFTYAQHEFIGAVSPRLTDEDWQETYYKGTDTENAFDYTDKTSWPKENVWYAPL